MDCEPVVLAHEPPFRIGDAEFRPATREVLRNGRSAMLEPRVMQLLVALHRAGGGVVTKDELVQLCWDGRIVGEDAINRVVSRLRSASEKIGQPFRVETITKVGYRLAPNGHSPAGGGTAIDGLRLAGPQVSRRGALIAWGAAAAMVAGALGWRSLRGERLPREARLLVEEARDALLLDDPDQHANAVAQLRRAAQIVPGSALVWGLMGLGYMRQMIHAPTEARQELRDRGSAAAQRALAIDPGQPDARAAMIYTLQRFRNWLAYERACLGPLDANPDHFELNALYGGTLAQVGRFAELLPRVQKCYQLAPIHPGVCLGYAGALQEAGRVEEAEAAYARAFALWPRKTGVWFSWFYYLLYNNRADEALTMVRNVAKRPLGLSDRNFDLVEVKAEALIGRDPARIRAALDQWEAAAATGTGFAENAIRFAANVGDLDLVFRVLDGLYFGRGMSVANVRFDHAQARYSGPERNTHFLFWRAFDNVRRDPRFGALTRELGLDDYWARSGSLSKVAV